MPILHIEAPNDEARLADWQYVHNTIVPPAAMSLDDVRERVRRNRLEVAYLGDVLVGCTTVRPPTDDSATATVIARVLAEHRGQGFGEELYARGLDQARALGAKVIETVVLAANEDGPRFARRHGFVEIERYVLPGETVEYVDLRLN
ncbi:GNAT family N-acetyltransferase [Streptomyces rhizosphaerihabitans]|uniref:GNAT family N-acetyltransferase n=1 Tax=Streptomyces rhizosphaerihabitans TaxID=1266770 RepID=UPI0021BE070F|nr:GNAT family N-acetyltransferase [Streptomyces rhizosphaerihabitans]MCT9005780.1 GNAT family N-acetyltransferase [Streptomyces rhizosphaerihabitans]